MMFSGGEVFLTEEQKAELKREEKAKERQTHRDFIGDKARGKSKRRRPKWQ